MIIKKNTQTLLFRFNNYRNHPFIKAHQEVLNEDGYVWMLKIGKRSSVAKIQAIIDCGGWLVLRSPKADGGKSYLTKFSEILEEEPLDMVYPEYYTEILDNEDDEDFYNPNTVFQWFKIEMILELNDNDANNLVISKSDKKVNEVIGTTRTAVMFIKNSTDITV